MTVVLRNALISVLPTELYLRRKAYYKRKRGPKAIGNAFYGVLPTEPPEEGR
jgi:hypothetical protein